MTRTTAPIAAIPLALGLLASPGPAGAELRQTGNVLAELGVSANGVTDDDFASGTHGIELDPLVGLSVAVMGRPLRYLSVGVTAHYGFLYARSESYEEEGAGFLGLLLGVRGHLPLRWVEPWLGLGFGYALAHFYGAGSWPLVGEGRGHVSLHGLGIGLDAGVGFHVADQLLIGPFFRMIFGVWPTGCYDYELENRFAAVEDEGCDSVEDLFGDRDLPHLWSAGIALTTTF